jgi:hypothetical protein
VSKGRTFPTGVAAPILLEGMRVIGRVRPSPHPQVSSIARAEVIGHHTRANAGQPANPQRDQNKGQSAHHGAGVTPPGQPDHRAGPANGQASTGAGARDYPTTRSLCWLRTCA